jgi:oligopeptide transport system substrate-binding protein
MFALAVMPQQGAGTWLDMKGYPMFNRKIWTVIVAIVSITCVLAICTSAAAVGIGTYLAPGQTTGRHPGQASTGVLRLYAREPVTLDPALAGDANSTEFIDKIFSGLVALDEKLEIVPELAEKWDVSEGGKVYTFHLRDGLKFQDGAPVTADDFKYTVERLTDPATGSQVASSYVGDIVGAADKLAGQAKEVKGVEVVDPRTIRITIDAPKAYFLSKLSYHTFFILDHRNVEQGGSNWWLKPNGTGPFKLATVSKDAVVLTSNKYYVGGQPPIARVEFTLRGGSPMTMYEQGELDATFAAATDIERVTDPTNPLNKELQIIPSLNVWYLAFDTKQPPFDDVKVRQALAYATNKDGIAKVLEQKTVIPAKGILPPGLPGYNKDLKSIPFDPAKAKQLLAESSYKDAQHLPPIVFATSAQGGTDPLAASLTIMYSETLGIDVELQQVDWDHFQQDLYQYKYQMFMLGWVGDYPDPEDFLDVIFYSGSEQNHSRYSNPEVDRLLMAARTEQDRTKRFQLYQQAEQLIVNDSPWVPIYHSTDYVLIKPYVLGLKITPMGEYSLAKARLLNH